MSSPAEQTTPPKSDTVGFKPWEMVLLCFFVSVFFSSLYFYATDFPIIRRYIFGMETTISTKEAGKLKKSTGKVRRQKANQSEFQTISEGDTLYYLDTLVTGPDVRAEIELIEGGKIELAQSTMVKLTFDSQLSLGGVKRQTNLELVGGSISGDAQGQNIVVKTASGKGTSVKTLGKEQIESKPDAPVKPKLVAPVPLASTTPAAPVFTQVLTPPAPPPPPPPPPPAEERIERLVVSNLSPERGAQLALGSNPQRFEKDVVFSWRTNLRGARLSLRVALLEPDGDRETVFDKPVGPEGLEASQSVTLKKPGDYEWILYEKDPKQWVQKSSLRLRPEFDGLELLQPLVGGVFLQSNALTQEGMKLQKDFSGLTLRWKPLPQTKRYRVKIYRGDQEVSVSLDKEVSEPEYTFNRGTAFNGTIRFRVFAQLPSGFMASSRTGSYQFSFLPPVPVLPRNGEAIESKAGSDSAIPAVTFTWQKTHFTNFYEIEISRDENFSQLLAKKRTTENYHSIPTPESGAYFWRVRSISSKLASPPSSANTLIIR